MKFTIEIEITAPREKVIKLFDNPENLKKWMKGLQSFKSISGTPGTPGAKSLLKFQIGKRRMEMIETVTVRDLPDEFSGTYEAKGVRSETKNFFQDLGNGRTKMISENEFRFSGLMNIVGGFMPGIVKKQSMEFLKDFKAFVESH